MPWIQSGPSPSWRLGWGGVKESRRGDGGGDRGVCLLAPEAPRWWCCLKRGRVGRAASEPPGEPACWHLAFQTSGLQGAQRPGFSCQPQCVVLCRDSGRLMWGRPVLRTEVLISGQHSAPRGQGPPSPSAPSPWSSTCPRGQVATFLPSACSPGQHSPSGRAHFLPLLSPWSAPAPRGQGLLLSAHSPLKIPCSVVCPVNAQGLKPTGSKGQRSSVSSILP